MNSSKETTYDYNQIISDIFNEVTIVNSSLGTVYLKHFGQLETKSLLSKKEEFIKEAESKGILSKQESLDILIKDEMWSLEKENLINEKVEFIKGLKKSLSKVKLPSQAEQQKKLIHLEEEKLEKLEKDKKELIGISSEEYAEKKLNRLFFDNICFLDRDFKKPFIDELDFSDFQLEVELNTIQSDFFKKFSDMNISKAVLSESYSPYFGFSESVIDVFGKSLKDMTAYQIKMATFARSFLMVFKNATKEIPDYVARDPEALLSWNQSQKENAGKNQVNNSSGNEDSAQAVFGATKDDIKKIKSEDETAVTLDTAIKKHGGNLNMQQLMEMHGV